MGPSRLTRAQESLDRFAMGASIVCLLHCLLTPLLVVFFPIIAGTLLARESFHSVLLFWVLPTSLIALWIGCRRHKDVWVSLLVPLGLAVLVGAAVWGEAIGGEGGEKIATVAGSLTIVAGHWRNFRLCRRGSCQT